MKRLILFSFLVHFMVNQSSAQCSTNVTGTLTSCGVNCTGTVIFTSSTGTPPYNLVVTGGPTTQYTSSYTWTNVCPGSYHYDIAGTSSSCHDTGTVIVTALPTVVPPPVVIEAYDLYGNFLGNNPTICQFQTVDFYIQAGYEMTEPKTFKWKKNGVVVSTQTAVNPNPPSIAWNSASLANGDVITLTIIFTNPPPCYSPDSVTSQNITFTVTPNQPPTVTVTDNLFNDTICHGNTVTFTANPLEAGTPTYEWYLDAAMVGTSSTYTTLVTLANGNHQVYCIITSGEYCDSQEPVFNPVVTSPTTYFYVDPCYYYVPASGNLGPYSTCNSPFYDSALDNPVNYSNNVNGMVKFCPVVPQYLVISFTSIALNDAGDRLRIFPGISSSLITADTTGTPLFNMAGPASSSPGPVVTSTAPGGCLTAHFQTNSSGVAAGWVANITCSPTVSIPEQSPETSTFSIYPNPATNEFTMYDIRCTISEIGIYNVVGKKILSPYPATKNQKQIAVDVSSLSPGIYFVKVRDEKGESAAKFVKQ